MIIKKIKEKFLSKELELLNVLRDDLLEKNKRREDLLQIREIKVKKEEAEVKNQIAYLNSKAHKEYMLEFKKQYQEEFDRLSKNVSNIIDFDLFPTKKVWTIGLFVNKPVEIEIKELIIKEKSIEIISTDLYKEGQFFKTEQEAIEYYNNYLESIKIKNA